MTVHLHVTDNMNRLLANDTSSDTTLLTMIWQATSDQYPVRILGHICRMPLISRVATET
jgi:hypothetical protein